MCIESLCVCAGWQRRIESQQLICAAQNTDEETTGTQTPTDAQTQVQAHTTYKHTM